MPLRYASFRAALAACEFPAKTLDQFRKFHASRVLQDDTKNHYETLNISPHASSAEIKKSFYALSKEHHPDHNPSDPNASRRFMRISEAYDILGHADKRTRYDHDVLRLHHKPAPAHGGSYSSTGPAGGRPASGLSRRRTTFRGPPPSFYRSGGWGAHSEKRRAAHEDGTGSGNGNGNGGGSAGAGPSASFTGMGGMGPGQDPFGHGRGVPHFDRNAHESTGRAWDARRARRRARDEVRFSPDVGLLTGVLMISGVLFLGIGAPAMLFGSSVSDGGIGKRRD